MWYLLMHILYIMFFGCNILAYIFFQDNLYHGSMVGVGH